MQHNQNNFKPLEITQVGIIIKNRDKAMQQFSSLLGIKASFRLAGFDQAEMTFRGKKTRCSAKLAFTKVGSMEIEFIEPGEGKSIWSEFLRNKGEGVQHLGAFIPDIDKELSRFSEMGIGVLHSGEDNFAKFAYLDTEGIIGTVLEVVQYK